MRMLAVYDITDPKRLSRVARILKDYGFRVLKSKFEIEVTAGSLRELQERVARVIDPEKDGVKYIPLCGLCQDRVEVLGRGAPNLPEEAYYVL